jgi:hypothetical protein
MEHGTIHTKPWWRVPLLLLLCLIGGSSPMWADTWHFAGNSEHAVVNHPTLSKPYMQFVGMFFDKTSGNNGYFTKTKPTSFASKIPSNAADGPAMFINGEYLCSPIDEFGWNGDGDGAWSACGNDTWWKNTYTRTINGITYTVKQDPEDYEVGDIVACIMYTKGTKNVKDDQVITMRYTGFGG